MTMTITPTKPAPTTKVPRRGISTMSRINRLTAKRAKLYSRASSGRKSGATLREQIRRISAELEQLWDLRRTERVGHLDGIDLLVERSYTKIYGSRYADAVAPPTVSEAENEVALVA